MSQSDQVRPRRLLRNLGRSIALWIATLLCWPILSIYVPIGCLVVLFGPEEYAWPDGLDLVAILVVLGASGHFLCGVLLGRLSRRISACLGLLVIAVLELCAFTSAIAESQRNQETTPGVLPVLPAVLALTLVTVAGIKLGRHWRRVAAIRRENPTSKVPWLQFRLRTLMLFVLLVAVVLGSWYTLSEPSRRRGGVIARIEERLGDVEFDYHGPAWRERLFGTRCVGTAVAIWSLRGYRSEEVTEEEIFRLLQEFTHLRVLNLAQTGITDEGLARLHPFRELEVLGLARTRINGTGLRHLEAHPALEGLDLCETHVSDENLVHLERLTSLRSVLLEGNDIGDEGLVHVASQGNLECLWLSGTRITDEGLAHLRQLRNLERLHLSETQVSDAGLEQLKKLKRLKYVSLFNTQVTERGATDLQSALPHCDVAW